MKRMKNPSLWRVPLAMALAALLLLASALPTWAAEDGEMTRFTADAAGTTITADFTDGSSKTYYRYESTSASPLQCHPYSGFGYTATLTVGGIEYRIASPEEAGEILYLYVTDENRRVVQSLLYLTEEGRAAAEAIGAEEEDIVTMLARKGTLPAAVAVQYNNQALQEALTALPQDPDAERDTFSAEELRYAPVYAVMNTDGDRWLGRVTGHIYDLHGAYYYIPLASIPAGCLQADGWIREVPGGSLTLIRVEEGSELYELIEAVIPSTIRHYSFTDESYTWNGFWDDDQTNADDSASLALLFIAVVLCGVLMPLLPIAAGLVLPNIRIFGQKKRWYLLAILGGAWLLCGVVLLVMMVVFM